MKNHEVDWDEEMSVFLPEGRGGAGHDHYIMRAPVRSSESVSCDGGVRGSTISAQCARALISSSVTVYPRCIQPLIQT